MHKIQDKSFVIFSFYLACAIEYIFSNNTTVGTSDGKRVIQITGTFLCHLITITSAVTDCSDDQSEVNLS